MKPGVQDERDYWNYAIDDPVRVGFIGGDDGGCLEHHGAGLPVVRDYVSRQLETGITQRNSSLEFGPTDFAPIRVGISADVRRD